MSLKLLVSTGTLFTRLASRQQAFSEKTFGSSEIRGPLGPLKHLKKEADEVIHNIQQGKHDPSEYADLLILVLDASWRAGLNPRNLLDAAHEKMWENETRDWPPPRPGDDAVEHIRTPSEQAAKDSEATFSANTLD